MPSTAARPLPTASVTVLRSSSPTRWPDAPGPRLGPADDDGVRWPRRPAGRARAARRPPRRPASGGGGVAVRASPSRREAAGLGHQRPITSGPLRLATSTVGGSSSSKGLTAGWRLGRVERVLQGVGLGDRLLGLPWLVSEVTNSGGLRRARCSRGCRPGDADERAGVLVAEEVELERSVFSPPPAVAVPVVVVGDAGVDLAGVRPPSSPTRLFW